MCGAVRRFRENCFFLFGGMHGLVFRRSIHYWQDQPGISGIKPCRTGGGTEYRKKTSPPYPFFFSYAQGAPRRVTLFGMLLTQQTSLTPTPRTYVTPGRDISHLSHGESRPDGFRQGVWNSFSRSVRSLQLKRQTDERAEFTRHTPGG